MGLNRPSAQIRPGFAVCALLEVAARTAGAQQGYTSGGPGWGFPGGLRSYTVFYPSRDLSLKIIDWGLFHEIGN